MRATPNSQLYRNNLAALLVESNRPDDAVTILSEAYGPAVAHYNVGYLLHTAIQKLRTRMQDAE